MAGKDFNYVYLKTRKNFGRQPLFTFVKAHNLDSIFPDEKEQKKYILRNPVHQQSQASTSLQEHYINTITITIKDEGANHAEGGWPRDIHFMDEEATSRYRRRYERDDSYIHTILNSYKKLENGIKQNNAIEMYDMFFKGMPPSREVETTVIRLNNIFRDTEKRKIASLSWTSENDSKLVVAYCDKTCTNTRPINEDLTCFVWNMDSPNTPESQFLPSSACWQAICSPVNPSVIIGGLANGRVCIFDIRYQMEPVSISPEHLAHRDPVSALVYMQTRLNNEFFSGSSDGCCKWWDIRNISRYTDCLIMSVRVPPGEPASLANSEGVNTLQFEKTLPAKFMCGTDTGLVISINRKGKDFKEMMGAIFEAQLGPVRALQRSPFSSKIFLTCGDWTVHLWSEDVVTSPIVTGMPHFYAVNDASWAPHRFSSFMSVSADGIFRYWDYLRKFRDPVKSILLSKYPLMKVQPHPEGELVAVADTKGAIYLLSLSNSLAFSGEGDKQLIMQMCDREANRERILESRVKEIRLKQVTDEKVGGNSAVEEDVSAVLAAVEGEFKRIVSDEYQRARTSATIATPDSKKKNKQQMRKR